jgi:hypothetical protein
MNKLLLRSLFLLPLAAAALTGCRSSYSHTDISSVSSNDLPSQVTAFHIAVTQGSVVTAHIAPFNSDEKPMIGDVQSSDPSTLEVLHAYGDKNYAFMGVKPGNASVMFLSDGVVVATIQSEVTTQAPQ